MSTAKSWFEKASQDLRMAKVLFENDPSFLTGTAFMCQQCVEKCIKGFLIENKKRPDKTHDLVKLSKEALNLNPNLKSIHNEMERLTEYAVAYRYPDAAKTPLKKEQVKIAIEKAASVYDELINYLGNIQVP